MQYLDPSVNDPEENQPSSKKEGRGGRSKKWIVIYLCVRISFITWYILFSILGFRITVFRVKYYK